MNHEAPSASEPQPVASDCERLIVCAATDRQAKYEAGYFQWSEAKQREEEEGLFSQIMAAIREVEPRACTAKFWQGFIRGY